MHVMEATWAVSESILESDARIFLCESIHKNDDFFFHLFLLVGG